MKNKNKKTDILDVLLHWNKASAAIREIYDRTVELSQVLSLAADEIERLRKENKELKEKVIHSLT